MSLKTGPDTTIPVKSAKQDAHIPKNIDKQAGAFVADAPESLKTTEQHVEKPEPPADDPKNSLSRDRFIEASSDIMIHLFDKVVAITRQPVFQERLQNMLDPLVQHVINRVFPYIIFSAILFLIMLLVTVSTFIIVVRGSIMAIRSVDMAMKTGVPENWISD
jgi:hypothetical protein